MKRYKIDKANPSFLAAIKASIEAKKIRFQKYWESLASALQEVKDFESGKKKPKSFNKFLKKLP